MEKFLRPITKTFPPAVVTKESNLLLDLRPND